VRSRDHQAPYYVVSSTSLLPLVPLMSKYSPQHPILKHPQPIFLSQCEWPSFTPIQNNRQNYSSAYHNLYIFRLQTGRQKILCQMIASIPWLQSALSFFLNRILIVKVVPKYVNSSTLSKELLSIFILWLQPAFWSRDIIMYLVLSAFTSSSVSLLITNKASVFFFIVHILPLNTY